MTRAITLVFLLCISTLLSAQDLEVEGKAKVTVMDPATVSAQPVAREPDGTLSLMTSGIAASATGTTFAIGDFAQGGVVFWVSADGAHCKVVSIYDVEEVRWSNITTAIGDQARSKINGAGNTVAIIMQSGHTSSAAKHCADLAYSGFIDWYLPSRDELTEIYVNSTIIDATALANGGEIFNGWYWSSTEFLRNYTQYTDYAWYRNFINGFSSFGHKSHRHRVRAIRSF